MSLNGALSTAARSLDVFSLGIQLAGNNIANANTPGFVRDELRVAPSPAFRSGSVLIGSGVTAQGVRQQLDTYLETRIHTANTDHGRTSVRRDVYQQLELALNELGDQGLSADLQEFSSSLSRLANNPSDAGTRQSTIQAGARLASEFRSIRSQITELQSNQSGQIQNLVDEANSLISTIEKLNPQISVSEANGLDANDASGLRLQRLNALNRLSEIIPIRVQEQPSGAIDLYTGSDYLILDGHSQRLKTIQDTSATSAVVSTQVVLTGNDAPLNRLSGELQGRIEARDTVLGGFLQQLDQTAASVIEQVNRIHAGGQGLAGYTEVTSTNAVTNPAAAINAAGLPFQPNHGSFQLTVRNQQTGQAATSTVNITLDGIGTSTTLNSLVTSLNAIGNVNASVSTDGRLTIKAANGYELRFGDDSSGLLGAIGINTFFEGTNADTITVNSTLARNPNLLASGTGGGPADSTNAVKLAKFLERPAESLSGTNIKDYYAQVLSDVAASSAGESAVFEGTESFRDSLQNQRQQRSGVSIDEEAVNVMALQKNYQAAARIISTVNELFDVLLRV